MEKDVRMIKKVVDILIVEDSITQAEKLRYLLEKNLYSVTTAENGRHALEILEQYDPTIIISDVNMPEMDGYELCRRIKKQVRKQDIPVILLTSFTDPEDVIEGLECGADNFITKPYVEDYLLSHVERVMASLKFYQTERVRIGVEIMSGGKRRLIKADMRQMLTLLMSTYEAAVIKNKELLLTQESLQTMNDNLGELVEVRTQELKCNVQKYKDLYDNSPSMCLSVKHLTCEVIECNETFLKKTGYKRSEVIGKHILTFFHPDCLENANKDVELFNVTGEIKNSKLELLTKLGGKVPVLSNSIAIRDDQGNILNSFTVFQDIE